MTTALTRVLAPPHIRGTYVDLFGSKLPAKVAKNEGPKKKVKRKRKRKASKKKRWYAPKVHSGWKKSQPAKVRRKLLLRAHKGNLLSAAKSKQALANVTQDEETREIALADARFFFEEHKRSKKEAE